MVTQSNKPKHLAEHNYIFQLSSMAGEHMFFCHAHNTLGTQCIYNKEAAPFSKVGIDFAGPLFVKSHAGEMVKA